MRLKQLDQFCLNQFCESLIINDVLLNVEAKINEHIISIAEMELRLFVSVPVGCIMMWTSPVIPPFWLKCDGTNGTPDLIDKFFIKRE